MINSQYSTVKSISNVLYYTPIYAKMYSDKDTGFKREAKVEVHCTVCPIGGLLKSVAMD